MEWLGARGGRLMGGDGLGSATVLDMCCEL